MTTGITTESCDNCRSAIFAGGRCLDCGAPTQMRRLAQRLMAEGRPDATVKEELVRAGYSDTRAAWVIGEIRAPRAPRVALAEKPQEGNWFELHLNWTWFLGALAGFILSVIVAGPVGTLLELAITLVVSAWVLKQKDRSLWWLLLCGWGSPAWLGNNRD